jgi:hypothetical protein
VKKEERAKGKTRSTLARKISRKEFKDFDTRTRVVKDKTVYNRKKKHSKKCL